MEPIQILTSEKHVSVREKKGGLYHIACRLMGGKLNTVSHGVY